MQKHEKMDEAHFESNNKREKIWLERIAAKCDKSSYHIKIHKHKKT